MCAFRWLSRTFSSVTGRTGAPSMSKANEAPKTAWQKWTAPTPEYTRWSRDWWTDKAIIFTVFGITGTTAMYAVRPILYRNVFDIPDDMDRSLITTKQRVGALLLMMPFYYAILLCVGTAFGRYAYVVKMATRPFVAVGNIFTGNLWKKKITKLV